jgi:hypothetical protein
MSVKPYCSFVLSMACAACTGSGRTPVTVGDSPQAAGQALMRSVTLAGAKAKHGGLPAAGNQQVTLLPQATDPIEPGGSTLLPLNVDNPDEAQNPAASVLMQFEGATDYLEVPLSASASGSADLNFEILVGSDVCNDLCNRKFAIALAEALVLKDGTVGAHANQDISLDCAKQGHSTRCAGAQGGSKGAADAGSTRAKDASASGRNADGGIDLGGIFGDAGSIFGDAGISFDFTCADQEHVSFSVVCDGAQDCRDGSDELGCSDASVSAFPCPSGGTVTIDRLCDGKMDCSDGFDEMVCVPCGDGSAQYSPYQQCDGMPACKDGTDEMGCDFTCTNGEHIATTKFCDGTNDCSDGSDETPCQFPCGDGTSVPSSKLCDGKADCPNGADEDKATCP